MQTFKINAQAKRKDNAVVCFSGTVKAVDEYAAGDKVRAILAKQGAEYYPVVKFGSRRPRAASPELALTLATNHAEESN